MHVEWSEREYRAATEYNIVPASWERSTAQNQFMQWSFDVHRDKSNLVDTNDHLIC